MSEVLQHLSAELKPYLVKLEDFELGESIGHGAYGEVFKAVHKKTGKVCAVKQLHGTHFTNKDILDFCREVAVLAKCDGMFLTPFLGWQAAMPLLIVTEFIPKGSLFAALRHRPGSPSLTGTHKTLIALGVAKGMATLHAKGIIHRDLKSLNVLLDDKLLPCICDFGVSRFADEKSQLLTKDVGTPHWMAPELFMSQKYTNKVDVYAYAILLWEMVTETVPFKGKSGVQIALAVCQNRERPAFPSHVPKALKQFISACWHQDPDKRPTFEQIVKVLCNKKVMFAGTNPAAIDFIRNEMREYEANHVKPKGPPLVVNEAPEPQRVPIAGPGKGDFNKLKETGMDVKEYKVNFEKCASELSGDNVAQFFDNVSCVFGPGVPTAVVEYVNEQMYVIIKASRQNLDAFMKFDLIHKLPLGTQSEVHSSFDILLFVATQLPSAIDKEILNSFVPFLKDDGIKMISVMFKVLENFDRMENGWTVSDHLIRSSEHFIVSCPLELLRVFNHLLLHYSQFYQARYEYVIPVLLKLLTTSQNAEVLRETYGIMIQFYSPNFVFDVAVLERHIDVPELRKVVMSFIIKQKVIHISQSLIGKLLAMLPGEEAAFYAIMCSCDRTKSGDSLIMHGGSWMTNGKMTTQQVAHILLILLCYPDLRPHVARFPEFAPFLANLLRNGDEMAIDIAETFLVRLGASSHLVAQLSESGVLAQIFEYVSKTTNVALVRPAVYLIDTMSRHLFAKEYLILLSFLGQHALAHDNLGLACLSALVSVCQHPEGKRKAEELGILESLRNMGEVEEYRPYLSVLLA